MHYGVGEYAVQAGVDYIYCAGKLSKNMYEGAKDAVEKGGKSTQIMYWEDRDSMMAGIREDEEERIRRATEDTELAGYYQQVQDALEGTGAGDSAEGLEDITAGEVGQGERRSICEALATKGRTKGTSGAEDRKREEQLPVPEQQAKRNRRRADGMFYCRKAERRFL